MTVSSTLDKSRQLGNGVTVSFSANIKIFEESELIVQILTRSTSAVENTLILNDGGANGYTVDFDTDEEDVTVTVNTAPTSLQDIFIYRSVPITQETSYPYAVKFPSAATENALDKITTIVQDSQSGIDRALKVLASDTSVSGNLPAVSGNSGRVISVNSAEDGFEFRTVVDDSTLVNFEKSRFSGDGSTTTFILSSAVAAQNGVEVFVKNGSGESIRQEAGIDYNISGTNLNFVSPPASGSNNIWVIDTVTSTTASVPTDGSVTKDKLNSSLISDHDSATISENDEILFSDDSDGGLLKKDTVQGIIDLLPYKILQVVSTNKTNTFTTSSTTLTDITGMSASITPSSTNSKIFVIVNLSVGRASGTRVLFSLNRDGSAIGVGDAAGSRARVSFAAPDAGSDGMTSVGYNYLDSPSTASSVTYNIKGQIDTGSLYINRSATDTDSAAHGRAASSITLIEVGQ